MLTALAQENVVLQGIKLGAKDYIRKPFHPTELVKRLAKHLAGVAA
jgi:DNA-binding response OmpR family regulator